VSGVSEASSRVDVRKWPTVAVRSPVEVKQKKEKKQKHPEVKSTLQRSKTFVNSLFKGGRKRDTSRGRSKSPSTPKGIAAFMHL